MASAAGAPTRTRTLARLAGRARSVGGWLTQPQISTAARDRRDTMVLLFAVAFVSLPHFEHLPWWTLGVTTLLWSWRAWLTLRNRPLPGHVAMLPLLLAAAGAVWLQYRTLLGREAGVTFLLLLLALKLLEIRATRDIFIVVFLCFFILLTQFLNSQALPVAFMTLAAVLALFFVLVSVSLKDGDLPAGRKLRLVGQIALKAVPLTIVLFVLFPRLNAPLWGLPRDALSASTGLSNSMAPGGISRLLQSQDIAFRVKFDGTPPGNQQLYWRGPVFGAFDGRTWSPLTGRLVTPPPLRVNAEPDSAIDYSVTLEPSRRDWLFALEMPARLPVDTELNPRVNSVGQMLAVKPIMQRARYDARSFTQFTFGLNETTLSLQDWLTLPPGFNPRTLQFAADLQARLQSTSTSSDRRAGDMQRAQAVLDHFRNAGFRYTLEPPPLGRDSVDEFLFETRLGYCEHFASAFVVLMRALDVPARVVTGYQGGEINPVDGFMTVRQSDAHAWAEIWLAGRGWTRIDPTSVVSPVRIERGVAEMVREAGFGPLFTIGANPDAGWVRLVRALRFNWEAMENSWNQWVLSYSSERQMSLLDRLGLQPNWRALGMLLAMAVAIVVGVLALISLRHRVVRDPLADLDARFRARLERSGVRCAPADGPRALSRQLARQLTSSSRDQALAILAELERWRYSPASRAVPSAAMRRLSNLVRRFRVIRAD